MRRTTFLLLGCPALLSATSDVAVPQENQQAVIVVAFSPRSISDIPAGIQGEYQGLFEDLKVMEVQQEPRFYIAEQDINADAKAEFFARVESPLTCAARGCEINIFEGEGDSWTKIFSAVADNIGVRQPVRDHALLVTNVAPAGEERVGDTPFEGQTLFEIAGGTTWVWNGKEYVPQG